MRHLKKYLTQLSSKNDNLSENTIEDPGFEGDLLLVAMLFWIVVIIILVLCFIYMIYDFLFVGTVAIRVLFGITILFILGLYIRRALSKARS